MANLLRILFRQDTFLKQEPIQASDLPSNKKQLIPAGTILVLDSYGIPGRSPNHYQMSLENMQIKGFRTNWYAFAEHVQIFNAPFYPVTSIDSILAQQTDKSAARIFVDRSSIVNPQGFLKLVVNVDTIAKRQPIDGRDLAEQSKQSLPAGTELVLSTNLPDANNIVRLPVQNNHIKFNLRNLELKGFTNDWFAFNKHVGITHNG